jgi:signal peptide peptidase SppA
MVNQVSGPGGTSTEMLGKVIRAAAADPNVGAIVLDVDSPGGAVDGTPEVVDAIFEARGSKPIVAVANSLAASAAYWIASAATEIVATPSGTIGSIGVMAVRQYREGPDPQTGAMTEIIHAGKYKAEGAEPGPLGDDARAHVQAMVDHHYGVMVRSIARNRGVSAEVVRSQFGEGRVFTSQEAQSRGMVDRIATMDATIARMSNPRSRSRLKAAQNELALAAVR